MPAALRGTTNAADKRTTSGAAAKPRPAGAACRRTPDPGGAPEAIALLVTVALHKWKHETLLSVAGGTLCYVLLVQLVF